MSDIKLDIIIPAWKTQYLPKTLESLVLQTDSRFRIYIGDDKSDEDIKSIVDKYLDKIDITYHRFDTHFGSDSLVQHWNRCIKLGSENWVWLFSDDDVADKDCVKKFHEILDKTHSSYDVYRFNSIGIDQEDRLLAVHPPHPDVETSMAFIYYTLTYQRISSIPEYIFRRSIFEENKGFVDFPLAWGSDHASMALFSDKTGIKTIAGPLVHWRRSDLHLTAKHDQQTSEKKLQAVTEFCNWIEKTYFQKMIKKDMYVIQKESLKNARNKWVLNQWRLNIRWCSIKVIENIIPYFSRQTGIKNSLLKSIASESMYQKKVKHFPYLAVFPKRMILEYPGAAKMLEKLLYWVKSISNKLNLRKQI